jgi:very-short-patch-repair endonuclease
VLYQGQTPEVVFEINGVEHYKNKKRMASDKIKMQLLLNKGVKIIVIPNQYVKHYEFIGELLNKIKGGSYQTSLF